MSSTNLHNYDTIVQQLSEFNDLKRVLPFPFVFDIIIVSIKNYPIFFRDINVKEMFNLQRKSMIIYHYYFIIAVIFSICREILNDEWK